MITRSIEPPTNFAAVKSRMDSIGTDSIKRAADSFDRTNQEVIGYIVEHKLSKRGDKTLGRVTSTLARSVNAPYPTIKGDDIESSIGTNVEYAKPHEFGIDENVSVPAHQRQQPARVFGKPNPNAGEQVTVRAHTRHMKLPARRMIGSGIEEREGDYFRNLEEDIDNLLNS